MALIGAGGIGKTSIALTVLHHDRIKERFGDNRRFVRCDQFAASRTNFLGRLSKVIGAGVENPDDLVPLRPYLSSKEMVIVLDNAESILDPQGADGQDIYGVVKELCEFSNVCLIITSRITTIPPDCKPLTVPTLSVDAARSIFRRIYDNDERPDLLGRVLEQLDFHPLSVTLLATVARQNGWDNNRLAREWEQHRTGVLRTDHSESLAATIELSLASPMFKNLGPHARELLGVVAFFPQGVDENNLDRLFPTIPNRTTIFDKLCTLSLTYRSNGFITMLVPLRDYLRPEDPLSSPLLCTTKDRYFVWLSAAPDPAKPGFKETGWITSEDANVEHLLDVFTSLGPNVEGVWRACTDFIKHLYWHKPRKTMLGPRIEGLPDDRCFKPQCLFALARLFGSVGNYTEQKRLLNLTLRLQKEEGDDGAVAITLTDLSGANRMLDLYKEGIHRAEEALEIYERIDDKGEQGNTLIKLAWLLWRDGQFDAAEEAASRAIEILPEKGQEFRICESHRTLGKIYHSKGERERAIHHFETALRTASSFGWNDHLFWIRCSLALLFCDEDELDLAHAHIERAKSHAVDNGFHLGRAALLQAEFYYRQRKFEDATSEASRALEILGKLGALRWVECCKTLLRDIERETRSRMGSVSFGRNPVSSFRLPSLLSPCVVHHPVPRKILRMPSAYPNEHSIPVHSIFSHPFPQV